MKRHKRKPTGIPGLVRRGQRAYYARVLPEAVGGDRIYRSLGAAWGSMEATGRAAALNTLWDRGDWPVLRRWAAGEVHITLILRAVRDGAWASLKRVNAVGVLLGIMIEAHLNRMSTKRQQTIENHAAVCSALLAHFGPDRPMHEVTRDDCETFLREPRPGQTLAPGTQRNYRSIAGAVWRYAAEREAEEAEVRGMEATLRRNPWKGALIAEPSNARPQVLTRMEVERMLEIEGVRDTPAALVIALGAYAGLRLAEITHLRPVLDVELMPGLIRVQPRDGEHAWRTKHAHSNRDVTIPKVLAQLIFRHVQLGFGGARYLIRAAGRDRPVGASTIERWVKAAFTAAGIRYGRAGEGLTVHSLRHFHATWLLSSGVSIAVVAERLGDTQEVVLSTYSHALPKDHDRAIAVLDGNAVRAGEVGHGEHREPAPAPKLSKDTSLGAVTQTKRTYAGSTDEKPAKPVKDAKPTKYPKVQRWTSSATTGPVARVTWLTADDFDIRRAE